MDHNPQVDHKSNSSTSAPILLSPQAESYAPEPTGSEQHVPKAPGYPHDQNRDIQREEAGTGDLGHDTLQADTAREPGVAANLSESTHAALLEPHREIEIEPEAAGPIPDENAEESNLSGRCEEERNALRQRCIIEMNLIRQEELLHLEDALRSELTFRRQALITAARRSSAAERQAMMMLRAIMSVQRMESRSRQLVSASEEQEWDGFASCLATVIDEEAERRHVEFVEADARSHLGLLVVVSVEEAQHLETSNAHKQHLLHSEDAARQRLAACELAEIAEVFTTFTCFAESSERRFLVSEQLAARFEVLESSSRQLVLINERSESNSLFYLADVEKALTYFHESAERQHRLYLEESRARLALEANGLAALRVASLECSEAVKRDLLIKTAAAESLDFVIMCAAAQEQIRRLELSDGATNDVYHMLASCIASLENIRREELVAERHGSAITAVVFPMQARAHIIQEASCRVAVDWEHVTSSEGLLRAAIMHEALVAANPQQTICVERETIGRAIEVIACFAEWRRLTDDFQVEQWRDHSSVLNGLLVCALSEVLLLLEASWRSDIVRDASNALNGARGFAVEAEEVNRRNALSHAEHARYRELRLLDLQLLEDISRAHLEQQERQRASDEGRNFALAIDEQCRRQAMHDEVLSVRFDILAEWLLTAAVVHRIKVEQLESAGRLVNLQAEALVFTESTSRLRMAQQQQHELNAVCRQRVKGILQLLSDLAVLEQQLRENILLDQNRCRLHWMGERVASWRALQCMTEENEKRIAMQNEEFAATRNLVELMKLETRMALRRQQERQLRRAVVALDDDGRAREKDEAPSPQPKVTSRSYMIGAAAAGAAASPITLIASSIGSAAATPGAQAAASSSTAARLADQPVTKLWIRCELSLVQMEVAGMEVLRALVQYHKQDKLIAPDDPALICQCISDRFKEPCLVTADHLRTLVLDHPVVGPCFPKTLRVRSSAMHWIELPTKKVFEQWSTGRSPASQADGSR